MPKRNYQFEKRQKDLAKKQKQEEKRHRKLNRSKGSPEDSPNGKLAGEASIQFDPHLQRRTVDREEVR